MRISFLTNILTPYRIHFFDEIFSQLTKTGGKISVFVMTDELPLRPWKYDDLKREYTHLLKGKRVDIGANDYLYNRTVVKDILDFKPDVLIVAGSWTYPTVWKTVFSSKIKQQCPVLFWTESHDHTGLPNASKTKPVIKVVKRFILEQFDGFCLPGKYAIENIAQYIDTRKAQIVRLPNLVDNEYYSYAREMRKYRTELREKNDIRNDVKVFFTPARMVELKGQLPFLLNAANVLNGKNVMFVFAGEGPDKIRIQEIAEQIGVNVRLLDYQNQEQIREWEALSDAFLLPSISDANPLTNIEAAWAGLPLCISCYVGNGPELVDEYSNGVIFDTLNKEDVEQKMLFILKQNDEWFARAGEISYKKAQADFEVHSEVEKFIIELTNRIIRGGYSLKVNENVILCKALLCLETVWYKKIEFIQTLVMG